MSRKKKRNVSGEWGFEQENQQNGESEGATLSERR